MNMSWAVITFLLSSGNRVESIVSSVDVQSSTQEECATRAARAARVEIHQSGEKLGYRVFCMTLRENSDDARSFEVTMIKVEEIYDCVGKGSYDARLLRCSGTVQLRRYMTVDR